MSPAEVMDVGRDALMTLLLVAGPVMLVALLVGLAIALLQALTQIQEMTLTFVPKIFAIFVALILFLPLMGTAMGGLMERIAAHIIGG